MDIDALEAQARAQIAAIDVMYEIDRGVGGLPEDHFEAYRTWQSVSAGSYSHADTVLALIERLRAAEVDAESYRAVADRVIEKMNPFDDDVAEVAIVLSTIDRAVAYIERQPCTCEPEAGPPSGWDVTPCERCQVLGRANDQAVDV